MPGPPPKPAAKRQRRNTRQVGALMAVAPVIPTPPPGLQVHVREVWQAFWSSPLAALVTEADHPALVRLFELQDELDRVWRAARKHRVVEGSQGQPVLNPLYRQADALRSEIRALEDRFGLTPMARLKLGVKFGEARRSLADELQREAATDASQDHDADIIDIAPL